MFHAVTQSWQSVLPFIIPQPGKTIQNFVDSPVTNGMDGQAEATSGCLPSIIEDIISV
jgi:hypothetical protein